MLFLSFGGDVVVFCANCRAMLSYRYSQVVSRGMVLFWWWRPMPTWTFPYCTGRVVSTLVSSSLLLSAPLTLPPTPPPHRRGVLDRPYPMARARRTTAPLRHRERPTDADGSPDGAPASSGVEVLSSEHYDVRDDQNSAGESSLPTAVAEGQNAGAPGAGSRLKEGGTGSGIPSSAADRAPAGGGAEGMTPEILIRPPSYGFNDKVGVVFSMRYDSCGVRKTSVDWAASGWARGLHCESGIAC